MIPLGALLVTGGSITTLAPRAAPLASKILPYARNFGNSILQGVAGNYTYDRLKELFSNSSSDSASTSATSVTSDGSVTNVYNNYDINNAALLENINALLEAESKLQEKMDIISGMMQEAKQTQLQQEFLNLSNTLDMGIAQESMTTKDFNKIKLTGEIGGFRNTSERLKNNGYDVSGLETKISDYAKTMQDKFTKEENQAKEDSRNDTALTAARLSGNKNDIANAQFDITKTALDRAKKQKERDTGDPELAQKWYDEKLKEATQQRLQTIQDGQIEEYNRRIQHNEMLKELEGKTQAEIDKLNRTELQNKLSYLNEELQKKELTSVRIEKLEQEKVAALQKSHEIDARNPNTAATEAKRRLKETSVDYAAIQVEAFNHVNTSLQNHLTSMLTGTESFSKGFKGIFRDMTTEVTNMMVKMWYNKTILGPLQNWWGNLLDGLFPNQSKKSNIAITSFNTNALNSSYINWSGIDGFNKTSGNTTLLSSMSNISLLDSMKREAGGSVSLGETYLVGERGPELFVPEMSGSIIPNHRLVNAINGNTTQAPPVTVHVINKTGVQTNSRQETQWNGQQYIVNVVLDAYSRNVSGMRDLLSARRSI